MSSCAWQLPQRHALSTYYQVGVTVYAGLLLNAQLAVPRLVHEKHHLSAA